MSKLRLWFLLLSWFTWCDSALAQSEGMTVGESPISVPGLHRVQIARPAARAFVLTGTANLGWIENFDGDTGSTTRLQGLLSAAYSPLPELTLGAHVLGRMDMFSPGEASENSSPLFWGQPTFLARYVHEFSEFVGAGVYGQVELEARQAPDIQSASPQLLALVSLAPHRSSHVGVQLGYHFDNSSVVVDTPASLDTRGRILNNPSSASGIPWGVGLSQRLGSLPTEWLVETSGRILVGSEAPPFLRSPWFVSLGARHPLSEAWSLQATVEASVTSRPDSPSESRFEPYPPRVGGWLSVSYRPVFKKRFAGRIAIEGSMPKAADAESERTEDAPSSNLSGRVVDEGGRPLSDVLIQLTTPDGTARTERTYADGTFVFSEVPNEKKAMLVVTTPGYDRVETELAPGAERVQEVVLYPAIPAGQVKGEIKTLKGDPIAAKITIEPGTEVMHAAEDGSFEFELSPGKYTILVEHEDFSPQKRFIVVEEHGVVILNIALTP